MYVYNFSKKKDFSIHVQMFNQKSKKYEIEPSRESVKGEKKHFLQKKWNEEKILSRKNVYISKTFNKMIVQTSTVQLSEKTMNENPAHAIPPPFSPCLPAGGREG